jgi:hypothetical protein
MGTSRSCAVLVTLAGCGFQHGTAAAPGDALGASDAPDASDVHGDAAANRGRVTTGLVALYEIEEPAGAIAYDTSGFAPPLDLVVPATGVSRSGGALVFAQAAHVQSSGPASKIVTACMATQEITIEAWIAYGALPDWSRIVAMSSAAGVGNAAMTSNPTTVGFDLRSSTSEYERTTVEVFAQGPQAGVHHLVQIREASGTKRIYLNNMLVADAIQLGTFDWPDAYALSLGNTPALDRPFIGAIHLVAIYDRALSGSEIAQNFAAGPDPTEP